MNIEVIKWTPEERRSIYQERRSSPDALQEKRLRWQHGLNSNQARLIAGFAFGEAFE